MARAAGAKSSMQTRVTNKPWPSRRMARPSPWWWVAVKPQKEPDRIDLVRVLRANPSAAAMVWLRRRRGVRRGRRRRPSYRTPPGRLSGRATGRAPGRAGPGAARRAALAWAALPAARHRPATPHAGRASARAGGRLRWVPAGSRQHSEPSTCHRRLPLQLTILARRIVPRLSGRLVLRGPRNESRARQVSVTEA